MTFSLQELKSQALKFKPLVTVAVIPLECHYTMVKNCGLQNSMNVKWSITMWVWEDNIKTSSRYFFLSHPSKISVCFITILNISTYVELTDKYPSKGMYGKTDREAK